MQALVEQGDAGGRSRILDRTDLYPGHVFETAEKWSRSQRRPAKHGGVYASHMRDEGAKVLDAIEEAAAVGKAGGMPVQLSHFKIDNKRLWGSSDKSLALVEKYRREGRRCRRRSVPVRPVQHESRHHAARVGLWPTAGEAIRERLERSRHARSIIAEMEQMNRDSGPRRITSYATVRGFEPDPSYEGKTITEITAMQGQVQRPCAARSTRSSIFMQPRRRADGVSLDGR